MDGEKSAEAREARLRTSWSENAAAWASSVRNGRIQSRKVTDAAVLRAVLGRSPRPRTALDVGCGEGWLARRLRDAGLEVTGFDASEALVRAARSSHAGGRYLVLDYDEFARAPSAVGDGYDVAVCNFSLLGEAIAPVLRGLAEVLRPGGCLVVQTLHPLVATGGEPYTDGWREESFRGMGEDFVAPMPWYFRTVGSWVRLLRSAGLTIEACHEPTAPGTGQPLSLLWLAVTE